MAQHCLLIDLNLWRYEIRTISRDLSDLVPAELLASLSRSLPENLVYVSGVDVTRLDALGREMGSYEEH